MPVAGPVEADEFAAGLVQAGLQAGDLAEPAVGLGFLDPVPQVRDDLDEPQPRRQVQPQAGTADALLTELTAEFGQVLTLRDEGADSLPA